jgi:hypothetical protein
VPARPSLDEEDDLPGARDHPGDDA